MIGAALTVGLSVPAAFAGWYLPPMIARRRQEHRLRRLCVASRSLVLTFDDGPGPELTPKVLDLLQSRGAPATFFLAGFRAAENPQIVDRIVAAGHEIGCHSHDHLNSWRTWPWRGPDDIAAGYRALARWVPPDGRFRPPHGKMTLLTWAAVRRRGAPLGWWTITAGDVEDPLPRVDRAARQAARAGGGVVLLHDFDREGERADFVLNATELLLDAADEHGWTVRTLSELSNLGERDAA